MRSPSSILPGTSFGLIARWAVLSNLLGWSVGCGTSSDQVAVYPVQGKVLHKGEPAAGATVVFYPATQPDSAKPILPQGTVNDDGTFTLRTYEANDGAPAGKYQVTVVWPGKIPEGYNPEMYGPNDQLNGRYSTPDKSGLTATVREGETVLDPFELE